MCSRYDPDNMATDFESVYRRADRLVMCTECWVPIMPGEFYRDIWGDWPLDGEMAFKQCKNCLKLIQAIELIEIASGCRGDGVTPPLGELFDHLGEYADRIEQRFPHLIGLLPSPDPWDVMNALAGEYGWGDEEEIDEAELGCPVG